MAIGLVVCATLTQLLADAHALAAGLWRDRRDAHQLVLLNRVLVGEAAGCRDGEACQRQKRDGAARRVRPDWDHERTNKRGHRSPRSSRSVPGRNAREAAAITAATNGAEERSA